MKLLSSTAAALAFVIATLPAPSAQAMCGCMFPIERPRPKQVAQKARILNEASKVAMVRIGQTTVMTMANDVKTKAHEFALVVPVPTPIKRKDVRVVSGEVFAQLDRISSPRLVETWDPDPCPTLRSRAARAKPSAESMADVATAAPRPKAADYGVKVEAYYEVGEYEIAILKATRGGDLREWLNRFHYNIPGPAIPVLDSYIKQGNRFFVAKVNLRKAKQKTNARGFRMLRPLQVRFETPKFMLPVRLGTVNAAGPQELVMYGLSDRGRIESTNYPMQRMPTGGDVPAYVNGDFEGFYKALFDRQTNLQDMTSTFLEWSGSVRDQRLLAKLGHPWGAGDDAPSARAIDVGGIRVDGPLPRGQVARVAARRTKQMQRCTDRSPRPGRMVLDLEIQPNGRVTTLGLAEDTVRDPKTRRCALRTVSRWRFPAAKAITSVRLPVVSSGPKNRARRRIGHRGPALHMTRMHFRYTQKTFPADLALQVTPDRSPFSVQFQIRHQARNTNCKAGQEYLASLPARRHKEARRLASLTGWDLTKIRNRMGLEAEPVKDEDKPWWKRAVGK